jgi:hypothetical protein
MKKLACLALLLALAPLAGATTVSLVLDGGGTTVTAGSTVTINVVADWAVSDNAGFNLKQSTTSAAGDATALAVGTLNAGFDLINAPGSLANAYAGTRFILIDRINGDIAVGSAAIPAGDPLYSFDLVIPAGAILDDTFTIDDAFGTPVFTDGPSYGTTVLYDGGNVTDVQSLTLTTVPEPVTIALLGLGTLFVLRRR